MAIYLYPGKYCKSRDTHDAKSQIMMIPIKLGNINSTSLAVANLFIIAQSALDELI